MNEITIKGVIDGLVAYKALILERRITEQGLKPDEAASVLGVSVSTIQRWCNDKSLEYGRSILGRKYITFESVKRKHESLLRRNGENATTQEKVQP